MKSICFIPARGGSKGIPRKNIKLLNNKPLIAYTIESAISSNLFEYVIVSTDDEEIANISEKFGAKIPFLRPKELALDTTTTDDVLSHDIPLLLSLGYAFDIFVLRDCTAPFIDEYDLKGAIELLKNSNSDAVFASIKAHPNPYFGMMEVNKNGFLIPSKSTEQEITRRQDTPIVYIVDGMFAVKTDHFLKNKKLFSGNISPYEISKEHGHMIDFEYDFKVAELLLKNN